MKIVIKILETVKDFHLMGVSLYRKRYFTLFCGEHPQLKSGDPMKETAQRRGTLPDLLLVRSAYDTQTFVQDEFLVIPYHLFSSCHFDHLARRIRFLQIAQRGACSSFTNHAFKLAAVLLIKSSIIDQVRWESPLQSLFYLERPSQLIKDALRPEPLIRSWSLASF